MMRRVDIIKWSRLNSEYVSGGGGLVAKEILINPNWSCLKVIAQFVAVSLVCGDGHGNP